MASLRSGFLPRLFIFAVGTILAAGSHALELQSERESPAGVIKIPMMVRADSPKIAISKEGKLIVAAAFEGRQWRVALFRFRPNGQVDRSFGKNGEALIGADGTVASITELISQALSIQPDGRIVVAGMAKTARIAGGGFLLMRFLPDGRLDTSLDDRGWTSTELGKSIDLAHDVTVQGDEKIVAAGGSTQPAWLGSRYDFAIVRYLPDGRLDPLFGDKGKVIIRLGRASEDIAYAVKQDVAGRLVVAGRANTGRASSAIALLRLDAGGKLDPSFGQAGKVLFDLRGDSRAGSIAIQPDQAILLVGDMRQRQSDKKYRQIGVAMRYTDAGKLDPAFGAGGIVSLPWVSALKAVKTQRDGKIVLLGVRLASERSPAAIVVVRLNADGSVDPSFGEAGAVSLEQPHYPMASGLAVSDSDEIYVAGTVHGPRANQGLIVFKLDANGVADKAFGEASAAAGLQRLADEQ
ncbi:MAG: hypothetical protein HYU78_18315 [Rhodocyclales bacterium]|nr:hypothetical protein [Rhodocyclales bacterium]